MKWELLERPFFEVRENFLADYRIFFRKRLYIVIWSNCNKWYLSSFIRIGNCLVIKVRLLATNMVLYFVSHFLNEKIEIFITVRIINSKIATSSFWLFIYSRSHSLLISTGVELVAGFIIFAIFAIFLRLEDERSLEVTVLLYLSRNQSTLSSIGVELGCQPSSSYL